MSHALEPNTSHAIHLRCPTSSGGKDWIGSVNPDGIHTFWGKTGHVNQRSSKPGNRIVLEKIIQEKLAKGYREVDRFHPGTGWESQLQQAAPPPSPPKPAQPKKVAPTPPVAEDLVDLSAGLQWDF